MKINGGDNKIKTITRKKNKRRINITKISEIYLQEKE